MQDNKKKRFKLSYNVFNTLVAFASLIIAIIALVLVNNQLSFQKEENKSNLIGDYLILEDLYFKIEKFRHVPESTFFFENSHQEQTIQYLKDLKHIVNQGVNNSLLKMNNEIYSQWWVFYKQIDFTINTLNYEILLTKYYNIPIDSGFALNGIPVNKNDFDKNTLESFKNYLKTFWIKGVKDLLEIKEIKEYRDLYNDLSNYGRIIRE
ncbi:MAG: hypothetical protein Q8P20_05615 [bacterium]|nr:hypothetical protein [bacterium]